jgi:hypothetical protein
MELTQQCIEEIVLAAREVDSGTLVITIQTRPEDKRAFTLKCEYEKRYLVNRNGRAAIPTDSTRTRNPHEKIM